MLIHSMLLMKFIQCIFLIMLPKNLQKYWSYFTILQYKFSQWSLKKATRGSYTTCLALKPKMKS